MDQCSEDGQCDDGDFFNGAEQCIESRPALGIRKFITVNTPFFISPAYSVPKITISRRSKLRSMLVVEVISEV